LPPPIVRSGIDDPIGMPAEISMIQNGVYSWRFPMLYLGGAIVVTAWIGPFNPVLFLAMAAVSILWVPATLRSRMLARSVLRYAAAHDDPTANPRSTPILRRSDWFHLTVVVVEIAILVWLLSGGTLQTA
jgi:hypothetical protein